MSARDSSPPRRLALGIVLSASAVLATAGARADVEVSGFVGAELRGFPVDPAFAGQLRGVQSSLSGGLEAGWQSADRRHQLAFEPFARVDAEDDERTHADLREAYWRYVGDRVEVLVGIDRVFWGVTESRHLVNVINQVDALEDVDEEDFLGQPMINIGVQRDIGRFDLYVLPYFRERRFGGSDARLRPPLPVDEDDARFEADGGREHVDVALRYAHFVGDWDVGLSLFRGTGREPTLVPDADGTRLVPLYSVITQLGLDLQYTADAWLGKLEAIGRRGHGDDFGALVTGVEYTLYQLLGGDADLGLLAEYLHDGRDERGAPATPFDDDLFLGARLALNDISDTAVLAGGVIDLHGDGAVLRVEAERRLGDSWKLELEGQAFVDGDGPSAAFDDDDFVTARLTRFF